MHVELGLQFLIISSLGEILFCGAEKGMLDANLLNSHQLQNATGEYHESHLYGIPSLGPTP